MSSSEVRPSPIRRVLDGLRQTVLGVGGAPQQPLSVQEEGGGEGAAGGGGALTSSLASVIGHFAANALHLKTLNEEAGRRLVEAAREGRAEEVDTLLRQGAPLNHLDDEGMSALHYAANQGNVIMTQSLLDANCDVNVTNTNGFTALQISSQTGKDEIVEMLVSSKHCDLDLSTGDEETTALALATKANFPDIAAMLIKAGADVNVTDANEQTALHLAAERGNNNAVLALLQAGASANALSCDLPVGGDQDNRSTQWDFDVSTPLILAASKGHSSVVKAMISSRCDLDLRDSNGRTALMAATEENHSATMELLIRAGASLNTFNEQHCTPLFVACEENFCECLDLLIEAGADVNARDSRERTPLHIAAMNGHLEVAKRLVKAGCRINQQDFEGYTPLHISAWNPFGRQTVEITKLLLDNGADLNIQDGKSVPPVIKAWCHPTQVKLLIQHGCLLSSQATESGGSLLLAAAMQRDHEMCELLLAAGLDRKVELDSHVAWSGCAQDDINELFQFVKQRLRDGEVDSLKHQCRLVVRRSTKRPLPCHIEELALPTQIQDFLLFRDIIDL